MRYLCLIYSDEKAPEVPGKNDWDTLMKLHTAFGEAAGGAGVLRGGEALEPTTTATTIRAAGSEVLTTDGPFAETKEQLGGYYIIEVDDLDQALHWASQIPHPGGCVEVRPIMEFG